MNLESPRIDQALIAVGGNGTRLQAAGIDVQYGKSHLEYRGTPLLAYALDTWTREGLRRFVFAGDTVEKLRKTEKVVTKMAASLPIYDVVFREKPDEGLGTTGLPFHYRDLLDEQFVFDFGQNAGRDVICDVLIKEKTPEIVVFKGFHQQNKESDHPEFHVDSQNNLPLQIEEFTIPFLERTILPTAVAAPYVLDQEWIDELPNHDFNFKAMIKARIRTGGIKVIYGSDGIELPEMDTPSDYDTLLDVSRNPSTQFIRDHEEELIKVLGLEDLKPYGVIPERTSKLLRERYHNNFITAAIRVRLMQARYDT